MNCFDWVHLSVSVRQKRHIKALFVNSHTKNSILCKIYVLVIKHLLLRLRINSNKAWIYEIRKQNLKNHIWKWKWRGNNFTIFHFFVNWLKVRFQQFIVILVIFQNGLHIICWKGSRKDVNKTKRSLKRFIHEMGKMILYLLSSLNICKF